MSAAAITVRGFKKTFFIGLRRKKHEAVREISFEVAQGEIFGFLGPNGAGKTTTIKALLGLIRPDHGELQILAHPSTSMGWRSLVGYLPESPNFYEYLTGLELVTWFGRLTGLTRHEAELEARRQLERVKLAHAMNRRLRSYSKGMLQRVGLAQTLVGSPQLLILDEPMTGLDPIGRKDVRELILELNAEGRTIFYSTHILPDVEMTCNRVAIIHQGRVQRIGSLEDILSGTTKSVSVRLSGVTAERLAELRARHAGINESQGSIQLDFASADEARAFVQEEVSRGAVLEELQPHRQDLESIFLSSLGGQEAPL